MKIFTIDKIREADQYTIKHEPISSVNLMERAATAATEFVKSRAAKGAKFLIVCGPGNNGGDGLVMARLLSVEGYRVQVLILNLSNKFSQDFQINRQRLQADNNIDVWEWMSMPDLLPIIEDDTYIVDAILGSGLSKPLSGFLAQVVQWLNNLPNITISIDIATGLYADKPNDYQKDTIVQPDYTLSFQFPKLAFMMPENDIYVGEWQVLDIGLARDYIEQTHTNYSLIYSKVLKPILKGRSKFMHKGQAGHLLLIAGSMGKMGAALLSAKSAMRTGVGLLTLHHPAGMHTSLVAALPELMSDEDVDSTCFATLPKDLEPYRAIGIGPGLGKSSKTVKAFKLLLQAWRKPLLIDADAINILADNPTYLHFVPPYSILTPHVGELHRLLGKCDNGFERIAKAQVFAQKYQLILVVKGAHTAIISPTGQVMFNTTGNPGMATAGAGDVLSGMIASLLAQGYKPIEAALLGVFLHGRAADIAIENMAIPSLMASDIMDTISKAYLSLL